MGMLDKPHARTWHAPSRTEQIQKAELNRLEDTEYERKRQMKQEIETLERVHEIQKDAHQSNRELMRAAQRTRSHSNMGNERDRLLMLEQERALRARQNSNNMALAGQRNAIARESALLHSPQYGASPMLGPSIHGSPMLGSGLGYGSPNALGMGLAAPRVRALSASHHLPMAGLAANPQAAAVAMAQNVARERLVHEAEHRLATPAMLSSPILGGTPRMRAVSTGMGGGIMGAGPANAASLERMRLEERKRNLMQRERALQDQREGQLRAKASAIEIANAERALHHRERELSERTQLQARDNMLDRQDAVLRQQERDVQLQDEMERRLRSLNVNSPGMASLSGSGPLAHGRQMNSPMAVPIGADGYGLSSHQSPQLGGLGGSSLLGAGLDSGLGGLSDPRLRTSSMGHSRSRSAGAMPQMGDQYGLDMNNEDDMMREAARLGINMPGGLVGPGSPYLGGIGGGGLGMSMSQLQQQDVMNRAGVSPRMSAFPGIPGDGYDDGMGYGGAGTLGRRGSLGSQDGYGGSAGLGGLGLSPRMGRQSGSLGGGMDAPLFGGQLGNGTGRRDSNPFEERPLFDTRGY